MEGMTGIPIIFRMGVNNRAVQESADLLGFYHIEKCGNLAGVQEHMWIDADCLELACEGHYLNRIGIKKNQRFVGKHI